MGFVVQRGYEAIDDPEDVVQDADGSLAHQGRRTRAGQASPWWPTTAATMWPWSIRCPPGWKSSTPIWLSRPNPSPGSGQPEPYSWWWGPWYEHQNLRDDQAEAFTTLLWDGVYEYTYDDPSHHAGHLRRAAGQGRGDVLAGGVWP